MVSVIHEGVLKLGKKPSSNSSRDWKQFLFVLKHNKDTKHLYLDYYKDANKRWQKQEKKGSIAVLSYCHFSLAHNCSYMFPLRISTGSEGDVFLAASTFDVMNKWYNCLQQHCFLVPSATGYYEFPVVPRQSTSTNLIKASGDCILAFTPQKQIVCAQQTSRQVFGVWPYSSLRKYWGDKEMFGFICGRRAPRGEGEFNFKTKQGEDIFKILERLIKVVSARPQEIPVLSSVPPSVSTGGTHGLSSTSAEEGGAGRDGRPQQPLPPQAVHSKHPEVRKRLSLAEPLPPTPDQQSNNPTPPKMFPMDSSPPPAYQPNPANTTIISETSPAYATAPLVPVRPMSQVQQSPSPPSQGVVKEVPPVQKKSFPRPAVSPPMSPAKLDEQEEDTYSHTSHDVPQQFAQRNASVKVVREGSIYHGLVRSDSMGSRKDRKRSSGSSSPDLDSVAMYDLAYRPSVQNPRELVPVLEGEYESLGDATRQLLQLREKNLPVTGSHSKGDNLSFGEKLRYGDDSPDWSAWNRARVQQQPIRDKQDAGNGKGSHDGRQKGDVMTDNPMYGSRENIFSDSVTDTASSINRERERSVSSGSGSGQDGHGSGQDGRGSGQDGRGSHGEQAMNDMERSMVMNPVYNECRLPNKRPESLQCPEGRGIFPGLNFGGNHVPDEPMSPLDDSMVDNPMYGGRKDFADIGAKNVYVESNDNHSSQDNDDTGENAAEKTPDKPAGETSSSPNTQNVGSSPDTPGQSAPPMVRSEKGYTRVDKIMTTGSLQSGEAGSPPPPLPPRLYSDSSA